MLAGFNTNIPYEDEVFHIQTEDGGKRNPVIISLLYHKGAILMSKTTSYRQYMNEPGWQEKVLEIMKEQHKGLVRQLMRGKIPEVEEIAGTAGMDDHEEPLVDIEEIIIGYIL